jgi:hypothetical protein
MADAAAQALVEGSPVTGPRLAADILAAWSRNLSVEEYAALSELAELVGQAIRRTQQVPATVDRRCMALVVTKLEEAEHWTLAALRVAVDRADRQRDQEEGS